MDTRPLDERIASAARIAETLAALPGTTRISDADAEATYAVAYAHFAGGNYAEAFGVFRMLVALRPADKAYVLGAALCQQRLHRYEEAILGFRALDVLDPAEPAHLLACAECELLAQRRDDAGVTLEQVIARCRESEAHQPIRARAQAMLDLLRKSHEPATSA